MSNSSGRCFRARRRTAIRKATQLEKARRAAYQRYLDDFTKQTTPAMVMAISNMERVEATVALAMSPKPLRRM